MPNSHLGCFCAEPGLGPNWCQLHDPFIPECAWCGAILVEERHAWIQDNVYEAICVACDEGDGHG